MLQLFFDAWNSSTLYIISIVHKWIHLYKTELKHTNGTNIIYLFLAAAGGSFEPVKEEDDEYDEFLRQKKKLELAKSWRNKNEQKQMLGQKFLNILQCVEILIPIRFELKLHI